MTDERLREILDRLYGGDHQVYAPVADRSTPPTEGALIITENELAHLIVRRVASSRSIKTGLVYGCAQGRDIWRRMQP